MPETAGNVAPTHAMDEADKEADAQWVPEPVRECELDALPHDGKYALTHYFYSMVDDPTSPWFGKWFLDPTKYEVNHTIFNEYRRSIADQWGKTPQCPGRCQ